MSTHILFDDVRAVLKGDPGLSECRMAVISTVLEGDGILRWVDQLPAGAQGWLCLTSGIHRLQDGQWRWISGKPEGTPLHELSATERQRVLSGEVVVDDSRSIHLRRVDTVLRAFTYTESQKGSGEPVLVKEEDFLSTEGNEKLVYRSFWRQQVQKYGNNTEIRVWQPWLSRFAGWRS